MVVLMLLFGARNFCWEIFQAAPRVQIACAGVAGLASLVGNGLRPPLRTEYMLVGACGQSAATRP